MGIISAPLEVPQQDSVQLRESGAYTIPEAARKAHRLVVDVEIVSVVRTQYLNVQYNLPQGDYVNVTYWHGKSIYKTRKVKYARERLIEWLNLEASIQNFAASNVLVTATNMKTIAAAQGILLGETDFTRPFTWAYPGTHLKFVAPPGTQIEVTCTWWPFEFPPFPFASAEPNGGDVPGGGDEYPDPRRNSASDPWDGNPDPSGPDPNRDARDYGPENTPPPPPDPEAGNVNTWKIHVSSQYFTGDAYFVCRGTPSISRGDDGRVVDATGGDPNQPASSGATITSRMFGGVDASSTVEVTKV